MPLGNLANGANLLENDILEPLILRIDPADVELDVISFQKIFTIVRQKKLITPMTKMTFMFPENCLIMNLMNFLDLAKSVGTHFYSTIKKRIVEGTVNKIDPAEMKEESADLGKFVTLFWFLRKIFKWQNMEEVQENRKDQMLMICLDWILMQNTFKNLAKIDLRIVLELLYLACTNLEFITSKQTQNFMDGLWKKRKAKIQGENLRAWMQAEKNSSHKILLMIVDSLIEENQSNEEEGWELDYSYFYLKLLNISYFSDLRQETDWFKKILLSLVKVRYQRGRFWLSFVPLNQNDFEEEILRAIAVCNMDQEFLRDFSRKAERIG